jgi:hypothetical protein
MRLAVRAARRRITGNKLPVQVPAGLPQVPVGPTRTFTTLAAAVAGTTGPQEFILDDGVHQNVASIPQGRNGFIVRSASGNPSQCKMDGQGGGNDGAPGRILLAGQKGIIRAMSPGTVKGIGFINGGGADLVADGEAGLYVENFASRGTLTVQDCMFDANENGIFAPTVAGAGVNVDLVVNNCEFGYITSNGQTQDGFSHDVYVSCQTVTFIGCRFPGGLYGNTIKSRSPALTVNNCWVAARAGRAIDYPEGGTLVVNGGTFTSRSTAGANFFSYAIENANNYTAGVTPNPIFTGTRFVVARANTTWNIATAGTTVQFSGCTLDWASSNAYFNVIGGGALSLGASPITPPNGTTFISAIQPPVSQWAAPVVGGSLLAPITRPTPNGALPASATLQPALTGSFLSLSAVPGDPQDNGAYTLGMRFQSSQSGYVRRILFYKQAGGVSTHTVSVWNATGTMLGSQVSSGETSSGWQAVTLTTPIAVAANTTYTVAYTTTNGHYGASSGDLSGKVSGILTAGSPAGYYAEGSSPTYPNSVFGDSNYWVDLLWTATNNESIPAFSAPTPVQAITAGVQPVVPRVTPKSGIVAPAVLQPSGANDIVGFTVQSPAGGTQPAQQVRFNQQFRKGEFPTGRFLAATLNGSSVAAQMDVKQRHSDNSVKGALITVPVPSMAAGTTWQGMLSHTATAPGTALTVAGMLSAGYNLVVTMVIGGTTYTVNGATLLGGTTSAWRQGPQAIEVRVSQNIVNAFRVLLDITWDGSGFSTNVIFANDIAMGATGGTITYSSITITQGGSTQFTQSTSLTQHQYEVWQQRITVGTSQSGALNLVHDIDYLEAIGAVPNYDLYDTRWPSVAPGSDWSNILATNDLFYYMPNTGARPDIGTVTAGNARWLMRQDATATAYATQQGLAGGYTPWNFYDAGHGRWISLDDYPSIWLDPRAATQPTQFTNDVNWSLDTSHLPELNFVPYILTGDRYYLDRVYAQASWATASAWVDTRGSNGLVANSSEQLRAQAWTLRQIENAAYAAPDGSYEADYFRRIGDNNWTNLLNLSPSRRIAQGEPYGWFPAENRIPTATVAWQNYYFASISGLASLRGIAGARSVLLWQANFLSGIVLHSELLDPRWSFTYELETAGTYAGMQSSNTSVNGALGTLDPDVGVGNAQAGYAQYAAMANGQLVSVFGGGTNLLDHYYAMEGCRAYAWLVWGREVHFRDEEQFEIMPRLPDGRLLTASEMQLVSGSSNVTTSTVNALVVHWGNSPLTITHGGVGSALLVDLSSATGLTLVGGAASDYLCGGNGSGRMRPGAGYNVVRAFGGATTVEADPAVSSTIEVHGFKTGQDVIDIIGTSPTASSVISGATVANGHTTLTIGSTSVILVGVASGLTTANFI